ncbi:MAG: DUF4249 domain-containing protein [Tannerellaceae bacterium]|jgi:hypothetical protein|nr:DUF4249 domain-containing protein [Tannerellaceae bacterium]
MEFFLLNRQAAAWTLSVVLLAGLSSCQERVFIDTTASAPRLVIYGYLTTDTLAHAIRLTRSSGYFSTGKPDGISGAQVTIRRQDGAWPLTESPSEPGLYRTADNVAGQIGETYTLNVSVDFDGDGQPEEYEAISFLPPAPQLDSIAVQPSSLSDHHMEVLTWGRLPEGEINYFSFHLYLNGRIVNDSLQGYSISNDEYLQKKYIEALPVSYLNQRREASELQDGDSLTLQVEGITREYALFITNAQSEYRGSMPLFSAPPANIETNIRRLAPSGSDVAGFFTAFSVNRVAMIYR